jgi:hypothetical protein
VRPQGACCNFPLLVQRRYTVGNDRRLLAYARNGESGITHGNGEVKQLDDGFAEQVCLTSRFIFLGSGEGDRHGHFEG